MNAELQVVGPATVKVAEVCERTNFSSSTVYGWIRRGLVPVLRSPDGRGVRVMAWWLQQYLERGEAPRVRKIGGRRV